MAFVIGHSVHAQTPKCSNSGDTILNFSELGMVSTELAASIKWAPCSNLDETSSMPPPINRNDKRSTALHEAGHAVAAVLNDIPCEKVYVILDVDHASRPFGLVIGQVVRNFLTLPDCRY